MLKRHWVRGNQWKWYLTMALTATALFASTARAAEPITDANVDAAVAASKTPEDHQALAAFFTSKAEAALASAVNHDKMAKAFGPALSTDKGTACTPQMWDPSPCQPGTS